jgi:hypothetical protein
MTITLPKFTKVQQAFSIYWMWLHDVKYEREPDAHPSWNGYTRNQFAKIREIKETMTDDERKDFDDKILPYKI